ncbi:adenosine deaminase/editase [Aspergillus spectabilis]
MGDIESDIDSLPSRIASLVHNHFDGLPKRSKPNIRDDGTAEWIPMTGIVLAKGENTPSETLTCITVTTGAKCLPASQIPLCKGLVLHDSHAEILAMRAFNFWLLSECHSYFSLEKGSPDPNTSGDREGPISPYIRRRKHVQVQPQPSNEEGKERAVPGPPFEIHPDIKIYMYCTCAPCGDASMELVMAAQDDPTPWEIPPPASTPQPQPQSQHPLPGRSYFSTLGTVRRKPSRADAEATKSKSCSDKLSLRQVSSLLNYETSLLVAVTGNAYLAGVVLPEEEISGVGVERCFGISGRMSGLRGREWVGGGGNGAGSEVEGQKVYAFRPFSILSIPNRQLKSLWPFRKPRVTDPTPIPVPTPAEENTQPAQPTGPRKPKPGNISAIWIRAPTTFPTDSTSTVISDTGSKTLPVLRGSKTGLFENIINGVRQGHRVSSPGGRGASALSRAKMWGFCREVVMASSSLQGGGSTKDGGVDCDHEESDGLKPALQASTYREFKKEPMVVTEGIRARKSAIQAAKEVLQGWVPNSGDEDWGLEVLVDLKKRKR